MPIHVDQQISEIGALRTCPSFDRERLHLDRAPLGWGYTWSCRIGEPIYLEKPQRAWKLEQAPKKNNKTQSALGKAHTLPPQAHMYIVILMAASFRPSKMRETCRL